MAQLKIVRGAAGLETAGFSGSCVLGAEGGSERGMDAHSTAAGVWQRGAAAGPVARVCPGTEGHG